MSQPTSSSETDASPKIKSRDPADRIGIYKRLEDVPVHRRLSQYESEYKNREVWDEFMEVVLLERYTSDRSIQDAKRAGRRWKDHMKTRGRHPALATPRDVESWCQHLVNTLKIKTAYNSYWVRVERFYTWLYWHRSHPHCYNPVLMAAIDGGASGQIWDEKIRRGNGGTQ
ncbi:hypothetical protein [Haloarchaeobius sp. FL176]|uniref:hypothetical protein n=1 Tax=Haloarchaeobius sp. FL176 TaxID=2967129 RepID=UPI0021485E3C|nr:hypothetical protein [Haloarchaeobius sp. FL176]